MYYSGYDRLHDQSKVETYSSSIGRLRIRRDGFVSRDAPAEGATLTTHPFELAGNRLEVNLDSSSRSWLKVEILDQGGQPIPGFGEEDADRLDSNDVHCLVSWQRKEDLSALVGRSIRLRFRGQSVKLYAFQFLALE